jgi:transcription initiation factor TFIID TATA-box-binding protein
LNNIAKAVIDILNQAGIIAEIKKIELHNIVITHTFQLKTTLEDLIQNLDNRKACYEPEQFPALIYKDWGFSFLLFSNGKLVIAGLKSIVEAKEAIRRFEGIIGI